MTDAAYRGTHVHLEVVSLSAGETRIVAALPGQEAALVLLEGDVAFDDESAKRTSVFEQRASSYRERAQAMRKMAQRAQSGSVQVSYLLIAQNWELLAAYAESLASPENAEP